MLNVDPAHSPANVGNIAARLGGEAQAAKNEQISAIFSDFSRFKAIERPFRLDLQRPWGLGIAGRATVANVDKYVVCRA